MVSVLPYDHVTLRQWIVDDIACSTQWVAVCQGAMKATFKAINNSPTPVLAPVGMSRLAQRRGKNFAKIDTEV